MTSTTKGICPRCGNLVPATAESLWGWCSKCLFEDTLQAEPAQTKTGGRALGDYRLGRVLGQGATGVVYEAIQASLNRSVALKILRNSESAAPASLRRFAREAESAARLDHPNIVPIYEIGHAEGQRYLSMRLVPGQTLREKLAAGAIGLGANKKAGLARAECREKSRAAAALLATVARAVQHAHEHSVLHRDLKPANILIDPQGQPHLVDFGLARLLEAEPGGIPGAEATNPNAANGTPAYMSPEQVAGGRLTAASDVYSLGAILYETLAGVPPHQAKTVAELFQQITRRDPRDPRLLVPHLDRDLATICLKCLEKNPAARYATAGNVADELDRWLRGEPILARPVSRAARAGRWMARNPVAAGLVFSICAGLLASLALVRQARARQEQLELHRVNHLQRLQHDLDQTWENPEQPFVLVTSALLRQLIGAPPKPEHPSTQIFTFGDSIDREPSSQAAQYAPLLLLLEEQLEQRLGHPAAIDLRLYKKKSDSLRHAETGQLDIQRISSAAYVTSKDSMPGLEPLARENGNRSFVIFTAADSGITNLAQIAGRRVLFGPRNSAATLWAKVRLARAGLRAAALDAVLYSDELSITNAFGETSPEDFPVTYRRVTEDVLEQKADVGIAPRRHFESARHRRGGLVELASFTAGHEVYAARPGLDSAAKEAWRATLASLQSEEHRRLLAGLSKIVEIERFEPVLDRDFDEVRFAVTNDLPRFEGIRH